MLQFSVKIVYFTMLIIQAEIQNTNRAVVSFVACNVTPAKQLSVTTHVTTLDIDFLSFFLSSFLIFPLCFVIAVVIILSFF